MHELPFLLEQANDMYDLILAKDDCYNDDARLFYTKPKSWTGEARKIRIELPTMRKMRMVDVWEGKSGLLPVISS